VAASHWAGIVGRVATHDPSQPQGVFAAGCPFCRVLHLDVEPCPRCDGRERLVAAQMLDRESVERAVGRAVDEYDGSEARLDALLQLLFVHGRHAHDAMARDGRCDLARLRRDEARWRS